MLQCLVQSRGWQAGEVNLPSQPGTTAADPGNSPAEPDRSTAAAAAAAEDSITEGASRLTDVPDREMAAAAAAMHRRRLAEQIVSGLLPETTADERPSGASDGGFSRQWYDENRPPHHG